MKAKRMILREAATYVARGATVFALLLLSGCSTTNGPATCSTGQEGAGSHCTVFQQGGGHNDHITIPGGDQVCQDICDAYANSCDGDDKWLWVSVEETKDDDGKPVYSFTKGTKPDCRGWHGNHRGIPQNRFFASTQSRVSELLNSSSKPPTPWRLGVKYRSSSVQRLPEDAHCTRFGHSHQCSAMPSKNRNSRKKVEVVFVVFVRDR